MSADSRHDGPALPEGLWAARTPDQTRALYGDWAARYDGDMAASGYVGPARCAAMAAAVAPGVPVLDFGCGTGLAGMALAAAGFATIDGTDVTAAMVEQARAKGIYRSLTVADPDAAPAPAADIRLIVACGVVSFGAGPATLLPALLTALPPGGWLVATYNDTTLGDAGYMATLARVQSDGLARLERAEHGPQLPAQGRGATVYGLRRL